MHSNKPKYITKHYDWLPKQLVGKNITEIASFFDVSRRYISQLIYRSEGKCYDCGRTLHRRPHKPRSTRCWLCRRKRNYWIKRQRKMRRLHGNNS